MEVRSGGPHYAIIQGHIMQLFKCYYYSRACNSLSVTIYSSSGNFFLGLYLPSILFGSCCVHLHAPFSLTVPTHYTAGTFQSPAVIEALMSLLDDRDPNVRAVAAICLGRTGTTEERVVERLIELLKDGDRIVRQSACLSLGAMKAVKAIPHIGNIW